MINLSPVVKAGSPRLLAPGVWRYKLSVEVKLLIDRVQLQIEKLWEQRAQCADKIRQLDQALTYNYEQLQMLKAKAQEEGLEVQEQEGL